MPSKLLAVIQRQRVYRMPLKRLIDRPHYLYSRPALCRIGIQIAAPATNQRDQIVTHPMHRITLPISQPLAAFDLCLALDN
jgi:hypothetical protein